ncbi:MAG: lipopolysaccharide heptosyltransferase II [Verrucomicrobiae bacterium]|nr:lipopolysaccharide heptosyltransferase II [Verrucomicrobiae bacterium]
MDRCEPLRMVTFHLNQVGDMLFSLPALLSLRAGFPGAHLTAVVRPYLVQLVQMSGLVDAVIPRPKGNPLAKVRLGLQLRNNRFHVAVSFSQAAECVLLTWLTGAAVRVGFKGERLSGLFSIHAEKVGPPSTANNLRLVQAIGCPVVQTTYVGLVKPSAEDEADAERLLHQAGVSLQRPIVVLGPGTSGRQSIKQWPAERFGAIADYLVRKGAQVLLMGTSREMESLRGLTQSVVDLSGRTTLPVAAAVLKRARLFVGVDSGLMHLAAAVGTRCVALFGPTDPRLTGPHGQGHEILRIDLQCSPCLRKKCRLGRECMLGLSVETVIQAIEKVW